MESNAVYLCENNYHPIVKTIPIFDLSRFSAAYVCVNWFFSPHSRSFERRFLPWCSS